MRVYNVTGQNLTLANAAVSLVAIYPAATAPVIKILRMWASQAGVTTTVQQRVVWGTKVTAFQTVVSAEPALVNLSDPISKIVGATTIAAGKCGINASAEGAGALTIMGGDTFSVINGWQWVFTPEDAPVLSTAAAAAFTLQFPAAAATLTGWSFGITYAEI